MKAVILAAGRGTRLKKHTENLPKGMLQFCGKTLIERQIELYKSIGIDDVTIVCGYAAEKINYGKVKYFLNKDFNSTNMVESLMAAQSEFNDDLIVSYSDILFTRHMLCKIAISDCDFAVAVDDNWKAYWLKRYGKIDFDTESLSIGSSNDILSIGLENPNLHEIDARYIGLLKFSQSALRQIVRVWERDCGKFQDAPWQQSGKPIRQAYMTDLLNALIKDGFPIKAVRFNNGWLEFDTNEDYENACEWAMNSVIGEDNYEF
ncbi:MAG: phosphocholine cytidylyltransferase family protein [Acidaminococcales bacterium]|nr:phosphocholine cytidylyltransferase family protein [Acidaminococcales bacterium]